MTQFDNREQAFERKFAVDEETRFKIMARRDKLLAEWAAGLMGLSGGDVDIYTKELVKAALQEAGDEDLFRKLRADFDAKGVDLSDHQIRREIEAKGVEAQKLVVGTN